MSTTMSPPMSTNNENLADMVSQEKREQQEQYDTKSTLTTLITAVADSKQSLKEHCVNIRVCEYECSLWKQYVNSQHRVGKIPLKLEDYFKTPVIVTLVNNYRNMLQSQSYERIRIKEIEYLHPS